MESTDKRDLLLSQINKNSILFFSLFSAWLLTIPFHGQLIYCLYGKFNIDLRNIPLISISAHFLGLIFSGYIVDSLNKANKAIIHITIICIIGTMMFFLPYNLLWNISLYAMSFAAGIYIGSWGFYFKKFTKANKKVETIVKVLILSNVFMLIINTIAINISIYFALSLTITFLVISLIVVSNIPKPNILGKGKDVIIKVIDISKPMGLLWIFIAIITINSGLMYSVVTPAFSHHVKLTSWYWAIPYIVVLFLLMKSPDKTNKAYILNIAIAIIGISFLLFIILDRSIPSYLLINTLMLGAFGVCDLFWWSIIGELIDYVKNPAKIFGIGLSANVFGILVGDVIIAKLNITAIEFNSTVFALIIVFIILMILPSLHKHLSLIINQHIFLFRLYDNKSEKVEDTINKYPGLTSRENEIVDLLLKGRTYKMIAEELYLSENTIKTHIKNIYAKYNINSKAELIKILTITRKR